MTVQENQTAWKRNFFTIWTGQAFSIFGSSLAGFALVWWLTSTTGSASVLAGGTLMMILPQIFLGPLAGALVDRWPRKRVMLVADGLIALFSLGLVILFATGVVQFWHVYVILLARAVGGAFHTPAMQASTPLMVPEKHLNRVAGMNNTLEGVKSIVSPPLAALLLGVLPVQTVLLIDVLTAVLALLPLAWIPIPNPSRIQAGGVNTSVGQDMREGLRFVRGWPGLLLLMAIAGSLNILIVPALSFLPLLVTEHFGLGALELGWLEMVIGIGTITGGLLLSVWGGFRSRILSILLATILMGLGFLVVGLTPVSAFGLALAGIFMAGCASPVINGLVFAMLQSIVPPAMQGRIFSLLLSAAAIAAPIGLGIGGPVADSLGVQTWYLVCGGLTLLAGLAGFFIPALLRIESQASQAGAANI